MATCNFLVWQSVFCLLFFLSAWKYFLSSRYGPPSSWHAVVTLFIPIPDPDLDYDEYSDEEIPEDEVKDLEIEGGAALDVDDLRRRMMEAKLEWQTLPAKVLTATTQHDMTFLQRKPNSNPVNQSLQNFMNIIKYLASITWGAIQWARRWIYTSRFCAACSRSVTI